MGAHGLSRQTVRRAMQDLVSEGLVYRVRGRGTFAAPRDGRYLRQFGSVDDLMGLSLDTRLELLAPLRRVVDPTDAARLRLQDDVVHRVTFRRLHDDLPLCHTVVSLPPEVAAVLADVADLHVPGSVSGHTVLGLLDARLTTRVVDAEQSITVTAAPHEAAAALGVETGAAVLRIDRIYSDSSGRPVELAVSWFHPDHYSYRVRLHRSDS